MLRRWFLFLHNNWVGVILTMTLLLFSIFVFAFFRNGEFGTHYDLASCWGGVGAIATAAATGYGKWWTDSKYNSADGQKPD
ncbi:MAG: hypothetical protein P4N59_29745 [Negativicutes bacterium]|nr:hypothetical protein [Negativicutes bacterium]